MSKRGVIGRVTQLSRANVSALIDSAEDPQSVLDQFFRDYTAAIADAEQAIAELVGNLSVAEDDQQDDAAAVEAWGREAAATSRTADELRATGDAGDADRFDNLARVALERQLIAEHDVETVQHTINAQIEGVETLANGLDLMRIRLSELTHKRDSLMDRFRGARPQHRREGAVRSVDIMDPGSEVARFDEMVRREEERVGGTAEQRDSPLDAETASRGELEGNAEIEERLKALKTGRAMAAAMARAHDQPFR